MDSLLVFPEGLLLAAAVLVPTVFVVWLLRNQLREEKSRGLEALREAEGHALDPTFRVSEGGIVLAFNEAAERTFGYAAREILGRHVGILLPAAAGTATTIGWNAMPGSRKTVNGIGLEAQGQRKDGAYIPLDLRFTEVMENGGRQFVAVARDLTERVEKERLVREAELTGGLLHSIGTPVLVLDKEGKITRNNAAFLELTGYAVQEVEGRSFWEVLLPNAEWSRGKVALAQVITGNGVDKGSYRWKTNNGKIVTVVSSMTPMRGLSGKPEHAVLAAAEIPASVAVDAAAQSAPLEALERLAGGVAQRFNELLTSIQGYSELVLHGMDDADPLRRDVEEIKKASDRAAALTSQLLVFSRKQPMRSTVFHLNDLIGEMKPMLTMLLGDRIQLTTMLDLDLGLLRADAGWMEQTILNLAVNARDAMPKGGKLTIETSNAEFDAATGRRTAQLGEGEYIVLTISDSGVGMDAATKEHLFEPFFSTKRESRGAGMGLATVYGVVRQAGGNVMVQSVPGSGTHVKVYLPRMAEPAEPERPKGLFLVRGATAGM